MTAQTHVHPPPSPADTAKAVAETVKDKASDVAATAREETADVLSQAGEELRRQAHQQTQRLADGLTRLGAQLDSMAAAAEPGGIQQAARSTARQTQQAARWLAEREPGDVLGELQAFGRRKPGTFLLLAAAAGFATGRLVSGLRGSTSGSSYPATPRPALLEPSRDGRVGTSGEPGEDYLPGTATTDPRTEPGVLRP